METQDSIERLKAAAALLESVKADMPSLSLRLHNLQVWNSGMEIVPGTGRNSQTKIRIDWANLHRANTVIGRADLAGCISAYLRLDGMPDIPLLDIGAPALVTVPGYRAKIMEAVAPLPLDLRLKVCKMLARYLLSQRRRQREKKAGLLRQLKDLEGK